MGFSLYIIRCTLKDINESYNLKQSHTHDWTDVLVTFVTWFGGLTMLYLLYFTFEMHKKNLYMNKKKAITDISYNKDIPFEMQEIHTHDLQSICPEFASYGNKDGYVLGYNARHPMCMSCNLAGPCARLGRSLNIGDILKEVKDELGIHSFYSEHKLGDEVEELFEVIVNAIFEQTKKAEYVKKDKLEAKLHQIFTDTFKVATPVFAQDFIDRIYKHENIVVEENEVIWNQ